MELMMVALIVATLSVMALVSYTKMVNRSYGDDAIRQLTLIHGANQIYKAKHGRYWPNDGTHTAISDINTNLQLNLNTDKFAFNCAGTDGISWGCTMQYNSSPNFIVQVTQNPIDSTSIPPNPQCTTNCP